MQLRNWELFDTNLPVIGATVNVRDAILAHPNTGTVVASTTTDSNGMWAVTGLTDTPKDVEVIWGNVGQYHKWYKGYTQHDIDLIFFTAGSIIKRQLNYVNATDIANNASISATTWTDMGPSQTFTVDDAGSTVLIGIRAACDLSGTNTNAASRIVLDASGSPQAAQNILWGGTYIPTGYYMNPYNGGSVVAVQGLVAGTHSIKTQIYSTAGAFLLIRPSVNAYHHYEITVLEIKR
jgi:hypothetical protein